MGSGVKLNINAGGIFSKTMHGIQHIERNSFNVEDCYFNVVDPVAINEDGLNPFDYILDQTVREDYREYECGYMSSYNSKNHANYGRVEESPEYTRLKEIASKLKYKEELLEIVSKYAKEFTKDILGVHIRLSDMNNIHGSDYGIFTFDDYVNLIQQETNLETKIFVASDNTESIKKLQNLFKDRILFVDGLIRGTTEDSDLSEIQINNIKNEAFWREAFLEMLLLSKCSKLICRTSSLANMAIISSNTIQKIIML
jgi:hypothetical protein